MSNFSKEDELLQKNDPALLENLGTIRIVVCRAIFGEKIPWNFQCDYKAIGPVHEHSKKAGAHCVVYASVSAAQFVSANTLLALVKHVKHKRLHIRRNPPYYGVCRGDEARRCRREQPEKSTTKCEVA
jgi:hypothetical protein